MTRLNSEAVKRLLKKNERDIAWLSRQTGIEYDTLRQRIKNGVAKDELAIAKALHVNWKRIVKPE